MALIAHPRWLSLLEQKDYNMIIAIKRQVDFWDGVEKEFIVYYGDNPDEAENYDRIEETTDTYIIVNNRWVIDDSEALAKLKSLKMESINLAYKTEIAKIKLERDTNTDAPPDEVATWDVQKQEAEAYMTDNTTPTPFLSALAEARGVSLFWLVNKVIDKSSLFSVASGTITGKRQALEDRIKSAQTREELEQITWI